MAKIVAATSCNGYSPYYMAAETLEMAAKMGVDIKVHKAQLVQKRDHS